MHSLLRQGAMARVMPALQMSRRLGFATMNSTDLVEVAGGTAEMQNIARLGDQPVDVIQKKVRIFQPSRKVMQSSSKPGGKYGQWRLEFPRGK